jgi:hypothetical protein
MSEIIVAVLMLATAALFVGIALHASRDHKHRSRD